MAGNGFITEIRKFFGMQKDFLPASVPPNKYIDAQNVRLSDKAAPGLGGATLTTGNKYSFALGYEVTGGYKAYRIEFDISADNIVHVFTINGVGSGNLSSAAGSKAGRYAALVAALEAVAGYAVFNVDVYIPAPDLTLDTVHAGVKFTGGDYTLTENVDSSDVDVQVIKEYLGDSAGAYIELKTINSGDDLFILKTNGSVLAIDAAKRNDTTGVWTNVTVFKTKQIDYATSLINLVDFVLSIDMGDRCSFYYSGTPPRVTYIQHQDTWTTQSAFTWNEIDSIETGNPLGYYTFENVAQSTQRQQQENTALVTTIAVQDTGGSLTTGNKIYFIRQCVGYSAKTNFGLASNPVSIFQSSLTDTQLYGNIGGEVSVKSVELTITGLNEDLYDSFELAYVENIDGVLTQWVLTDKFPIGTATITHTGFEAKAALTSADLLVSPVIFKSTGNEVINRARLYSSDITIQLTPPELAEFSKTCITIATGRGSLSTIGNGHSSVNEYQRPGNVFATTGYMLNETYRFGIQWKFKNGFVCEPCFSKDHTFTWATGDLTDAGSAGVSPTEMYVFYANITVDLTGAPDINGLPFADVIDGYSIVRRECVPEILATGYISLLYYVSASGTDFFVGKSLYTGAYPWASSNVARQYMALTSPDIQFGQVAINALPGDQLLNYGQPYRPNAVNESRVVGPDTDVCSLFEFEANFGGTYTALEVDGQSDFVDFNSTGSIAIKGSYVLNTGANVVDAGTPMVDMDTSALALGIKTLYAVKKTAHADYGFYYVQYYRPIPTGKYGSESSGNYQSCGHYTALTSATSYNSAVYGGDTFTEKTFLKYNTAYADGVNSYHRLGVSFYSQNRANIQMRYFTDAAANNLDYPYTTASLVQWLSGGSPALGGAALNEGQLKYSPSYTPIAPVQVFPAFNPDPPTDDTLPSTEYYSELKIDGSPLDPFRVNLPFNFKSYTGYGRITNTFADRNALIIMCEDAIIYQQLDQQQTQTDPNGTSIIIGDGTVLGAREEVISYFGSPMKTGALQYVNKAGSWFVIWYNTSQKKVYRRGGDGISVLSEENFNQTFFSNNNQFVGAENTILFGWDAWSEEVLMRAQAAVPGITVWNAGSTYTAGDIAGVPANIAGGVSGTNFSISKARIAVPVNKSPALITNQLNYWDIYRNSNYLIAFNEHDGINDYSSFYGFTCTNFIPFKDTFLTNVVYVDGGLQANSYVYEHNKNTLKYYAAADGSGGTTVSGYITSVFNMEPKITKMLRNVWIRCFNLTLTDIHFKSSNGRTRTFAVQADIVEKRPDEGAWFANVKNDATIGGAVIPSGTNTTGDNELCTQRVEGQTNEVTIFFTNDDNTVIGNINEVLLNGVPKPQLYSS